MKYDNNKSKYVYMHCEYETENYTLINKKEVTLEEVGWRKKKKKKETNRGGFLGARYRWDGYQVYF